MTLDSTYLRARLARVIQEHLRLHTLDSLGSGNDRLDIVLHELTRECKKHGRRLLAFCPYEEITMRIMQFE